MKNKSKFALTFFLTYLFLTFCSYSSESFNFDVTEIEIKNKMETYL